MSPSPLTDLVGLFVLIAAALFSNEAALIIGPYMLIIVMSTVGASWSLQRREKTTRLSALGFFLRVNGVAIGFTGLAAAIVTTYWPGLTERALLAPVALLIGAMGGNWSNFFQRFGELMLGLLGRVLGKEKP